MNRPFYLPSQSEGLLSRILNQTIMHRQPVPDFPRVVQIQTKSGCNGRCIFCPNGRTKRKLPQGTMPWDLYTKIIDECVQHPVYRYSPYLNNEPLLDRDLGRKIRYIADRISHPNVTKINSNGSLLDEEMGRMLIESKLDQISFSVHGIDPEEYGRAMGNLKLENTLDRINAFLEMQRVAKVDHPRVRVTMVHTSILEPQLPAIQKYWQERGVKINVRSLTKPPNSDVAKTGLNLKKWQQYAKCTDLFQQAFIMWNGDVILCCFDWECEVVLGNVAEQSLYQIWNGERYRAIREKFLRGDMGSLLCASCLKDPDQG